MKWHEEAHAGSLLGPLLRLRCLVAQALRLRCRRHRSRMCRPHAANRGARHGQAPCAAQSPRALLQLRHLLRLR